MSSVARRTRAAALAPALAFAALTATLAVAAAPADARGSDVVRRGSCTGSTDWKLKAGSDDGRIEVEAEVDSNVVGQTWRWRLLHNGDVTARGTRTTGAPSGSFDVRRLVVDLAGADTIALRARQPRTGEVCRGSVRF